MNAIELNTKTVKALNVIARDLGMKRYSALRKAALIAAIVEFAYQAEREAEIAAIELESSPNVEILDVENPADTVKIADIMAEVALTFSATPVKAPESAPKAAPVATLTRPTDTLTQESTDELILAYRNMRATQHSQRGLAHAKSEARLARIERVLKSRKVNMREV